MSRKMPPLVKRLASGRIAFYLPAQVYERMGQHLSDVSMIDHEPGAMSLANEHHSQSEKLLRDFATELMIARSFFLLVQPFNRFTLPSSGSRLLLALLMPVDPTTDWLLGQVKSRLHEVLQ